MATVRAADPAPAPPGRGAAERAALRVLLAGVALALALAAGFVGYAVTSWQEAQNQQRSRGELLARVLEDHASRSFETVSLALAALAELLARQRSQESPPISSALAQTLAGVPLLRGVALLDLQGEVLASTTAGEVGTRLRLPALGPLPGAGAERIGGFVRGRGLVVLAEAEQARAAAAAPAGVGFVPVLRLVGATPGGADRLLVALVNADAIANHQTQILADERAAAVLASDRGRVLAATRSAGVGPGGDIAALPPFAQYLPATEAASYRGPGLRGDEQVVAFRAARRLPLVVMAERSVADLQAQWRRGMAPQAAVAALAVLTVLLLTAVAARAAQARATAQAEVAARERELSVIVKSVQELLFRTDAEGRLTFVNARWSAATGAGEEQALGRPLADSVDPESTAAVRALFDGRSGLRSAVVWMGPPAHRRRFELAVLPLQAGAQIVGYAGSAVDVTEREQAQQRLQSQLAFIGQLLEVMPLPVSMMDTDNRYLSVNQAWEEFTGRRREAVIGRHARDYLPPDEAAQHDARDRELLQQGGRLRYEAVLMHQDGSRRDIAVSKAAVPGADGRPAGVLVAFMDVSEFRDAERAVREARDIAEEASRAKSEFIANISHELRTPLQSIIGFSELGRARSGEAVRLGAMFGDIHAAGERMLALVNDLLDVSKIDSAVGTFHLERIDVRTLVREVLHELQPLLAARRLHVELQLSEAPLVAKVDPLRYQQVLRNVLANAIRFSPTGQLIEVAGDIDADNQVHISVRDHGPGIPAGELEAIFEAFVQSSKTKDGSGGTGLGLTISRKIMAAHGGRIHAENVAGGGAAFHVRVPGRSGDSVVTLI